MAAYDGYIENKYEYKSGYKFCDINEQSFDLQLKSYPEYMKHIIGYSEFTQIFKVDDESFISEEINIIFGIDNLNVPCYYIQNLKSGKKCGKYYLYNDDTNPLYNIFRTYNTVDEALAFILILFSNFNYDKFRIVNTSGMYNLDSDIYLDSFDSFKNESREIKENSYFEISIMGFYEKYYK